MAFTELELQMYQAVVQAYVEKRRPPPDIRPELDIGFRITDQSIELFELRPRWQDPSRQLENPIAKASYVRTQDTWKVFWMRSDLKWHAYPISPEVHSVEAFLALVARDEGGHFWG